MAQPEPHAWMVASQAGDFTPPGWPLVAVSAPHGYGLGMKDELDGRVMTRDALMVPA
jgi:hypothetical protein